MEPLDAREAHSREGGPSFPLGNRLVRALWQAVWLLLASWTPPLLHPWRALLLRAFGAKLGRNCRVHASVRIWLPSHLTLGDNVLIGPRAIIYNMGPIAIGSDTVISQRSHLCSGTHDVDDPWFQIQLRPIAIGRNCWIAAEAFVGPGVVIGDEAVLSARAALFENAEVSTIYAGNPAKPLRKRALRAAG